MIRAATCWTRALPRTFKPWTGEGVRARSDIERQRGHRIGICTPVLGELWAGVEGSSTRESRDRNLRRLRHTLSRLSIWPYTDDAAEEFGRLFIELKRAGRPIQQIDMQIGAIARTLPNYGVGGIQGFRLFVHCRNHRRELGGVTVRIALKGIYDGKLEHVNENRSAAGQSHHVSSIRKTLFRHLNESRD